MVDGQVKRWEITILMVLLSLPKRFYLEFAEPVDPSEELFPTGKFSR